MRRDFDKGVLINIAPQRGETAASMPRNFARQRTAGFPLPHGKFFRQLKRIFVNKTLEKAKTALFAFSPTSEELHTGKVKPRHFYNGVP